jgi:hypothetical protein
MKRILFVLALLALCLGAVPSRQPTYTHETARLVDIGIGFDYKPNGSNDSTCWSGCKLQNPGGCVLHYVTSKVEKDGTLHCTCTWVCMPALKAWQ